MVNNLRKLAFAAVLGFVGISSFTLNAQAGCGESQCNYGYYQATYYVSQNVPYQVCVIRYDHCGTPYRIYETRYRAVQVPVTRWVQYSE